MKKKEIRHRKNLCSKLGLEILKQALRNIIFEPKVLFFLNIPLIIL